MECSWKTSWSCPTGHQSAQNGNHRRSTARRAHGRRFAICQSPSAVVFGLGLLCVTLSGPGCREKDPGFDVITLEGKIDRIKRITDETGEITVIYYSEKHKQDMAGIGVVTRETEIMINGAIAKLKDLREGDSVSGEVRVEKKGKEKRQIALKIHVDRPTPVGDGG